MNQAVKMPTCLPIYSNTISVTVIMYNIIKNVAQYKLRLYFSQGIKPRSSSVDPAGGKTTLNYCTILKTKLVKEDCGLLPPGLQSLMGAGRRRRRRGGSPLGGHAVPGPVLWAQ